MPPPPVPDAVASSSRPASRAVSYDIESGGPAFAQKRELEELRIKVRILEGRKTEDQERIKQLESRVTEADTLRAARIKLQGKSLSIRILARTEANFPFSKVSRIAILPGSSPTTLS